MATVRGTVNPNGCPTTYHFEYGTSTTYGSSTADTSAGSGTSAAAATAALANLKPNTQYHFRIVATSAGGTVDGADGTFTTKPGCVSGVTPTVVTKPATNVAASSATVNATVNPNGCATTYQFQYGTTTAYGKATATHNAGTGTTPSSVSAKLSGLSPNTVYHYRVVATSSGGTANGVDMTFKTPAGCVHGVTLPTAVTRAATGVTKTAATLNGTVGPNGCATTYFFEYGLTTSYGSATAHVKVSAGSSTVPVSAFVSGLAQNTTYHFRLVVKSSAGTTDGADQRFRTTKPAASRIRIDGRRPAVRRGFLAAIHLHCTSGSTTCVGKVRLSRNGLALGAHGFTVARGTTSIVLVKLNARGRRLMRHHLQLRHVEVVARSNHNTAVKFVTLVRTFRP